MRGSCKTSSEGYRGVRRPAPILHKHAMAEKTQKLIDACDEAVEKLKDAVQSVSNAIESFGKSLEYFEKLKDDVDGKSAQKFFESVITNESFASGSIGRLELAIEGMKAPIKELESKTTLKRVMNVFSTQKSLDDAKKCLADTKKERDLAVSDLADLREKVSKLSLRRDKQSERSKLMWLAAPILEDLNKLLKTMLPELPGVEKEAINSSIGVRRNSNDSRTT